MMRNKVLLLVVYMCSALLFMQWSGLHMHIECGSSDSALHVYHLHGFDSDHHDHSADPDVPFFELSAGWFKLLQFFVFSTLIFLSLSVIGKDFWPPPLKYSPYSRSAYWRPILRAPPVLL